MKNETNRGVAAQQYAAAHAAHHTTKDLRKALMLYKGILALHPNTKEAGYAQTQIQNIVIRVVPKEKLLDAQLELALACLGPDVPTDVELAPVTSLASEPTS